MNTENERIAIGRGWRKEFIQGNGIDSEMWISPDNKKAFYELPKMTEKMKKKTILFGNIYSGFDPLENTIETYVIYFPSNVLSKDLTEWANSAKHGDTKPIGNLQHNGYPQMFLCLETEI